MGVLPTSLLRAAAVALGLTGLFAVAALAHHYRLESASKPAPFLRDGRADFVIENSGVAPLGDGRRVLVKKPDDKVRAFAADITDAPSPDATLSLRRVFAFDAGRREGIAPQLTSLEYVPAMGGFLVLMAMAGIDNAFHGNTLWLVNNGQPNVARSYATIEDGMKAGGLAVLGVKASGHETEIKLLITDDNDPHATKLPSRFQMALLVHPRD